MTKILLTKVSKGVGKTSGKPYAHITGITEKGEVVDSFLDPDLITPEVVNAALEPDDLNEIMKQYRTMDISYNSQGRPELLE